MTESKTTPTVAVIGAGISGLTCARTVAEHGLPVVVFDKGRVPGGRMSTRRTQAEFEFDHGCQYFSAHDERFLHDVQCWREAGIVDEWRGRIVDLDSGKMTERRPSGRRYVGVPGMSSVCRHLAKGLDVRSSVVVDEVRRFSGKWHLSDATGGALGEFDCVIVALPPSQAAGLLGGALHLAMKARSLLMTACWTVMVAFDRRVNFPADAAVITDSSLAWVARNTSKPDRKDAQDCWVLQASPEWSAVNLDQSQEGVARALLHTFFEELSVPACEPIHLVAHRWRYAMPKNPLSDGCLFDKELQIAACGDWCLGNRVEAAFLSGLTAAGRVLASPGEGSDRALSAKE